jgi:hypothetical protein
MCVRAHAASGHVGHGEHRAGQLSVSAACCAGIPRLYHSNGAHRATLGERTPPTPSGAETAVCEPIPANHGSARVTITEIAASVARDPPPNLRALSSSGAIAWGHSTSGCRLRRDPHAPYLRETFPPARRSAGSYGTLRSVRPRESPPSTAVRSAHARKGHANSPANPPC